MYASWPHYKSGNRGGSVSAERFLVLEKKYLPMLGDQKIWGRPGNQPFGPNRGICDYSCTLDFGRPLTGVELEEVCEWLHNREGCPGWTGVDGREYVTNGKHTYGFSTTMDSSD